MSATNSVGGAASSYKSGDLFVEGSLHLTSDPHDPRDPKHRALRRAGVIDAAMDPGRRVFTKRAVSARPAILASGQFHAARATLTGASRSPCRDRSTVGRNGAHSVAVGTLSQGSGASEGRAKLSAPC